MTILLILSSKPRPSEKFVRERNFNRIKDLNIARSTDEVPFKGSTLPARTPCPTKIHGKFSHKQPLCLKKKSNLDKWLPVGLKFHRKYSRNLIECNFVQAARRFHNKQWSMNYSFRGNFFFSQNSNGFRVWR